MKDGPETAGSRPERSPRTQMAQLLAGGTTVQAIYVAAKLGIADLLADGARDVRQLAAGTGVDAPSLYRLLRALASLGVFEEGQNQDFSLTALGATLREGAPKSLHGLAMLMGEPFYWGAWGLLEHSVRTGEPAFAKLHGQPLFDYLAQHPGDAEVFDGWMAQSSGAMNPAILSTWDFGAYPCVVDVGGGTGSLLAMILQAHPHVRGILYDLPHVIAGAEPVREYVEAGRCELVGGDFFESVPSGGDAYLLKHVVHAWSDEDARRILARCRRAMEPGARVLVVESVVPPPGGPRYAKLIDLQMLVVSHGGRERTRREFGDLFAAAGLELARVQPTPSPLAILEGTPAGGD